MKKTIYLLFLFFLLSCQEEEKFNVPERLNIENLKKQLDLEKFTDTNIKTNLTVYWNDIKNVNINDYKISEIDVREKLKSSIKFNQLKSEANYK